MVHKTVTDECGRCHTVCERVMVTEARTRCVSSVCRKLVTVPVDRDRKAQQKEGMRTVCKVVPTEKEVNTHRVATAPPA